MGYNFKPVERDQQYLLPPSIRDWLPEDDLAWFVLDVVAGLDLEPIRARYRADGWGAPAFDPALMTALLLYAYATGERSSRRIESACRRDLGYRVITANQVPDHATIARFRADHEAALGGLFGDVLRLCRAAGLGALGVVALDGTRLAADASPRANRTADQLDAEIARILAEHATTDAAEDEAYGSARRGDELPPELADRRSRLARLSAAREQLAAAEAARQAAHAERVRDHAAREAALGHRPPGARPGPPPAARPRARANTTDPDSRPMKTAAGWTLGYNAQAVVAADGLVLAAGLSQEAADATQLRPMLAALRSNVERAGFEGPIGTLVADAGYWSPAVLAEPPPGAPELLIPPKPGPRDASPRRSRRTSHPMLRRSMEAALATERGAALFALRATIAEPLFGDVKHNRRLRRFQRRGQAACASEWQLEMIARNLRTLWRHRWGRPPDPARSAARRGTEHRPGAELPSPGKRNEH
jgi:transposase